MMFRYGTKLKEKYEGKQVTNAPAECETEFEDLDWLTDEDDPIYGDGSVILDLRPYNDEPETDEDDEEYDDYSSNIELETSVSFSIGEDHILSNVDIDARLYGDDGLGDVDPEDEWSDADYERACAFFDFLIGETISNPNTGNAAQSD